MRRRRSVIIGTLILAAGAGAGGIAHRAGPVSARPLQARVIGVGCEAPRTLRLVRYEDGSAKLLCNGRLLVRVSVSR